MKNTDKASIVFIVLVGVVAAYLLASAFIGSPNSGPKSIDTIAPISTSVEKPDSTIFNKDAINPTVEVVIGEQ
jgi:hypothetical protein